MDHGRLRLDVAPSSRLPCVYFGIHRTELQSIPPPGAELGAPCRCQTNDKDKTTSISDAESRITDLTSTIEEKTAESARLNTEIKNLDAEVAAKGVHGRAF